MAEAKKKAVKQVKPAKKAEPVVEAVVEPVVEAEVPEVKAEKATTKAGKHSPKAVKEAEEKATKEEKKTLPKTDDKPKETKKPTRSKADRAGKKYREAFKLLEPNKTYSLSDALNLAVKTSTTKFDSTVEMHINLGVDPRQADQNVRGTVILPAGTGKTIRVAVLVEDDEAKAALAAGADIAGAEKVFAKLDKEDIDFDVLIATPAQMPKLGKYARLLGPRGLMPNPKSGTVTTDIAKAVAEAKAGKVEYRVDSTGIVHLGVGKVSFGADKLNLNASAVIASIKSAKPASLKGNYVKASYLTTTMGPSIKFELN